MPGGGEAFVAINGSEITRHDRIRIGFHYLICIWCYRYGKQLRALRKIASVLPEHVDDRSQEALPHSSKERMKQVLRETWRE